MTGAERIGRYEVVSHLATGGMGQIYLARATGLGGFERQVVVKTLDTETGEDGGDALVTMFLDEARLVGALHHQYIAPVYEVGRDERGRYFLVMDYVHGDTALAVWKAARQAGGAPPVGFAAAVGSAVASALDYAHSLRAPDGTPLEIVHRDVSLSNIMVGHDGAVKLIDFGIAKFARRTTHSQIGALKGKIAYLAPEQVLGQAVDHRADIFALGIVLYELSTLAPAFDGASHLQVLEKITKGELAPPWQLVPGYPRELERIVMKALAVDPGLRYQDAGTLGRELEAFASRAGIPLGHVAIRETMQRLFDRSEPPGNRRRFARASSEVETGRHERPDAADLEDTPVLAGLDDAPTVATEAPVLELEGSTLRMPRAMPAPVAPVAPVAAEPAPLVVRIATPPPGGTVTAQVGRRLPTAPPRRWWWPVALVGLAVTVAVLVALL